MLDYAPDVIVDHRHALQGPGQWSAYVGTDGAPAGDDLLIDMVSALRRAELGTAAWPRAASLGAAGGFQPERMSGFCASS